MTKQPREETFLKKYPYYQRDDFFFVATDVLLTGMADKPRVEKLKVIFVLAAEDHNDETALKCLEFLAKAYRAANKSDKQFHDYLMTEAYWQIPDMKTISHGHYPENDEYVPTMFETKSWILEQVIRDWDTGLLSRKITKSSISIFRFLIAAFNPLSKKHCPDQRQGESEFELKARGRQVFQKEKDKILKLIRKHDTGFQPEELEEWMNQPWIPYEFEKTLAIARTREGGPDLWRKDIRNAQNVQSN